VRGHEPPLERAHVGDDVVDGDDRVADELARAVVGDPATAVDLDDLDAPLAVPGLAHRQLPFSRTPTAGVDAGMLEQQHRVRDGTPLTRVTDALLQGECRLVVDRAEADDPQLRSRARHRLILRPVPALDAAGHDPRLTNGA
jgi:hypothetical protein